MGKINIDKLVASYYDGILKRLPQGVSCVEKEAIDSCLADQGLVYEPDKGIVEICGNSGGFSSNFTIEAGKWYMCIRSLYNSNSTAMFVKDKLYLSPKDEYLVRDDTNEPEIIGAFHGKHFRPATEEEVALAGYNPYDDFRKSDSEKEVHKPRFKKGDWVVSPNGAYWHIDDIKMNRYYVSSSDGNCAECPLSSEKLYHVFTIQDAKDGDVLVDEDENYSDSIFIFRSLITNSCAGCYVRLMNDEISTYDKNAEWGVGFQKVYPATKEQRDLLDSKMREAGYLWDSNKLELKKVYKPESIEVPENTTVPMSNISDVTSIPCGTVIITPEGYDYLMGSEVLYPDNPDDPFSVIRWHKFDYKGCRFANEEEATRYFEKLASNGYSWNAETKTLEKIQKPTIEPDKSRKPDLDKTNGTNTIKFDKEEEPTKFMRAVASLMERVKDGVDDDYPEVEASILMVMARKQIASEINVDKMIQSLTDRGASLISSQAAIYRMGIEDALKIISNDKRKD